jgi:uncharacterized protein with HEPN domain
VIRVSRTIEITLPGTSIQVGELIDRLSEADRAAMVDIHYADFSGSRDPREHSYVTLNIRSDS